MQNTPKQWLVSAVQSFPLVDKGRTKTSLCQVLKAILPGRKILLKVVGFFYFESSVRAECLFCWLKNINSSS